MDGRCSQLKRLDKTGVRTHIATKPDISYSLYIQKRKKCQRQPRITANMANIAKNCHLLNFLNLSKRTDFLIDTDVDGKVLPETTTDRYKLSATTLRAEIYKNPIRTYEQHSLIISLGLRKSFR